MHDAVDVAGHRVAIEVRQVSKTLWIAQGEFAGSTICVRATNRRTAVNRWRRAAEPQYSRLKSY